MGNDKFVDICKDLVVDYVNKSGYVAHNGHIPHISKCNVFVVWLCKVLQNNKALLSTTIDGDTRYYEITYNGDKREAYLDAYDKLDNICIDMEEWKGGKHNG